MDSELDIETPTKISTVKKIMIQPNPDESEWHSNSIKYIWKVKICLFFVYNTTMSCTVYSPTKILNFWSQKYHAYIFLASFAANSAASEEILESFNSFLVVIESRAIALTICSGLNSKSISP